MFFRIMVVSLFLTGCAGPTGSIASESSSTETQKPVTEANLKRGRIVFLLCRSCHTLESDGAHLTGPNLHGVFDSPAARKEGYMFSQALLDANITWDRETLDAWLENPASYVPGNRMAFTGIAKESDRAALIAYLKQETSK